MSPFRLYLLLGIAAVLCAAPLAGAEATPAGTTIVHPEDGALMVWVPAGPFTMGIDKDRAVELAHALGYAGDYHKFAAEEWFPEREVYVAGFFIDKHEVTVARWQQYVAKSGYQQEATSNKFPQAPAENHTAYDLYPVTRVLWAEAQQYANFFGKQLPFERQWEKAARGTDARLYPWGNDKPTAEHGAMTKEIMGGPVQTLPVGSKPRGASPYGCMDMSGNVYEWTREWFEPYPNNPERERLLSYTGHRNGCLRGGSFYHAPHALPAPKRFGLEPDKTYYHIGFRTVWVPPKGYFQSKDFAKAKAAVPAVETSIQALRKIAAPMPANY